jgi:hypothetical protein
VAGTMAHSYVKPASRWRPQALMVTDKSPYSRYVLKRLRAVFSLMMGSMGYAR